MTKNLIFIWIFLLGGCSTLSYLTSQGIEQMRIQWSGIDNSKILSSDQFTDEIKDKIRLIEKAKDFFSKYFHFKIKGTYSQTVFLDREAVSWLVVASYMDNIKPYEFDFPFLGKFPYIGFFNKDKAQKFATQLQKQKNLVTWIRPVYAYSSMGYFEDKILSSFFHFKEIELVDLIFHELFHLKFFIKDEVSFNENLANFVSAKMLKHFYKNDPKIEEFEEKNEQMNKLISLILKLAKVLQDEFDKRKPSLTVEEAQILSEKFFEQILIPAIKQFCQGNYVLKQDCLSYQENWNVARLAELMTYEKDQLFLENLYGIMSLSLEDFVNQLELWYKNWKQSKQTEKFQDFLKKKLLYVQKKKNF